jgi:hypothetical protein
MVDNPLWITLPERARPPNHLRFFPCPARQRSLAHQHPAGPVDLLYLHAFCFSYFPDRRSEAQA